MPEILFIEGVSGVGKSTMVRDLSEHLRRRGHTVRAYVEFDYTNPIDFYCTAHLSHAQFRDLRTAFPAEEAALQKNAVETDEAVLVRYSDEDTPLFGKALMARLREREFCYHPTHLVPPAQYTATYRAVWKKFVSRLDPSVDFYLFDGSLLHHPINDMMRNYHATDEQVAEHVSVLLNTLHDVPRRVFYLYSDHLAAQLTRAHTDRKQNAPSAEEIAFWQERYAKDRHVLQTRLPHARSFNISDNGWDSARNAILSVL